MPVAGDGDGEYSDLQLRVEQLRRRATRFYFADTLRKPTRAELEEAAAHHHHGAGHELGDGHGNGSWRRRRSRCHSRHRVGALSAVVLSAPQAHPGSRRPGVRSFYAPFCVIDHSSPSSDNDSDPLTLTPVDETGSLLPPVTTPERNRRRHEHRSTVPIRHQPQRTRRPPTSRRRRVGQEACHRLVAVLRSSVAHLPP